VISPKLKYNSIIITNSSIIISLFIHFKKAKDIIKEKIQLFIHEKILLANDMICKYMLADNSINISGSSYINSKIVEDDCLLIYGFSSLVNSVIIEAGALFSNLNVIIVDSRPLLRGKKTLEKLVKHDIQCTYITINAISSVMSRVSKVIMGAHALLANGCVMSSIGSSQIALVAKSFNVPVVVCCETYKFCDKVQTDALGERMFSFNLKVSIYSLNSNFCFF
jgi:translation initiation factor eIF-2B subunit delta